MKKFVALLLAMLLVLVNVAALAEDIPTPDFDDVISGQRTNGNEGGKSPVITKTYTTTGTATNVYPTEKLTFTVTPAKAAFPTVTVGTNNTFNVDGTKASYDIPVNVPAASEYGAAGKYHYTVVEAVPAADQSQAVVYGTETFNVDVYISYKIVDGKVTDELEQTIVIYSGTETSEDADPEQKEDDFSNTYSVGSLTVTKEISGNLADPERVFTITIALTSAKTVANDLTATLADSDSDDAAITGSTDKGAKSYTFTFSARGGDSVTIGNIPTGVEYTVVETDSTTHLDDNTATTQMNNANDPTAYYVEGEVDTATAIADADSPVTITNTKEITIPTGIALDTVPYILILAVAMLGVVLAVRKREEY